MRIAIFTDTYLPQINGVSNTIRRMEDYFNQNGIEYKIFAPDYAQGKPHDNIETFYSIKFLLYPECRLSLATQARIDAALTDFDPDIIHVVTEFSMGWAGVSYAQRHKIPCISTYTTNFYQYLDYFGLAIFTELAWRYFRWFHNQCETTFCPSAETQKLLQQQGIQNVEIWGRGIDCQLFNPAKRTEALRQELNLTGLTLLYVGRISIEKDLDILFQAFQQLKANSDVPLSLVVAGDGPLKEKYQWENPSVIFPGYVSGERLAQLYASSDIFVFPSAFETLGNVVLEAMASGLPVVGVSAGGVKDNIIDGVTGLLATPKNAASFKTCTEELIRNAAQRELICKNALDFVNNKSWNQVFAKLCSRYLEMIAQHRHQAA